MVQSFPIEQVQEQAVQTNKLLQWQRPAGFVQTEISTTTPNTVGTELAPVRAPTAVRGRVRLIPPHVTESANSTVITHTNPLSHTPLSKRETREQAEADQLEWPQVHTRWPETTPSKPTQVPVNAHWERIESPSHAPTRSPLATLTRQYLILLGVLLAEYRSTWFFHVLNGLLVPMGFTFFILAVGGVTSSERAIYLLGGNLALSIATGPTAFLINKLGWARQSQEFDYWLALPISKLILVFALISVALVFALPGLLGSYLFASLLFGIPFGVSTWTLIPLIPLAVLPLAGVGAMLGTASPNGQVANIFSNVLLLFSGVLSPLMLPLEALPVPLQVISQFVPTTYAADAFRAALGGNIGSHLVFDIVILTLFSAVLLTFTYFRLDWRNT